jgi:hypothetical protein
VDTLACFGRVWAVDFEFHAPAGHRPQPLCLVARELRSGRLVRNWLTENPPAVPPYGIGPTDLFIAFYASAELGCHLALGWPMPARILDLSAEFRCLTAGLTLPHGRALLGALAYFGLDAMTAEEKDSLRALAIRGGSYTEAERQDLLDYCQADVDALARLLPTMLPTVDLPRALFRGRYTTAAARMEWTGVPLDTRTLAQLRNHWPEIQGRLITEVDRDYGVYEGTTFKARRWAEYLGRHGIPWPRLDSGKLALDDDTFKEMARIYPAEVGPIRDLRYTLGQLRLNDLAVGPDGRNRVMLSLFGSKTSRNQPSNSKFIFGPAIWLRSLVKPGPGRAVAYVDWSAQELGVAAYLSGDPAMQEAYRSGDPYLFLARQVGAVPAWATKESHAEVREVFKVVSLGVLYGLTAEGAARKLDVPPCLGRELLNYHRDTFPRFWQWSELVEMRAMLLNRQRTVFGWTLHVPEGLRPGTTRAFANPRTYRNFYMQAHGAEMMRLACMMATEEGIEVCCPVHDALLVEGPSRLIGDVVLRTKQVMEQASELVMPGFRLRTDEKEVSYPRRYRDKRGKKMWGRVRGILSDLRAGDRDIGVIIPASRMSRSS